MNVLFIAPLPPPVTGHSLAAKIFLSELKKTNKVEIINLSKTSLKQGLNSFSRIIQVVGIINKVWRKKKYVDLIYFTISESFAGNIKDIIVYIICFNCLNKMIIHLHGGSIKKLIFNNNKILYRINKYLISRMCGTVVLGESHIDIFSDIIDKKKIHVVHNFAEDYLFLDEDIVISKFNNIYPLRILFISNLISGKGYNELVDAYISLNDIIKKEY